MRGYSLDLRERVVKAVSEEKQSVKEVAELFGVSRWTVNRYLKRAEAGNLAESVRVGQQPRLSEEGFSVLKKQVSQHKDWTLEQHAEALSESQAKTFKKSVIGKYLKQLGITLKKDALSSGAQRTSSQKVARVRSKAGYQKAYLPRRNK